MTFNKKLLALAVAHFAFSQFIFAADGAHDEKGSKTSKAVAHFAGSTIQYAEKYVDIDKAIAKTQTNAVLLKDGTIAMVRWAAITGYNLGAAFDGRTGLCTRAKGAALDLDRAITARGEARQICGFAFYQWAKGKATVVVATTSNFLFPHQE